MSHGSIPETGPNRDDESMIVNNVSFFWTDQPTTGNKLDFIIIEYHEN